MGKRISRRFKHSNEAKQVQMMSMELTNNLVRRTDLYLINNRNGFKWEDYVKGG